MKRTEKLPELLAPAGDFDALTAAILAGADAIYAAGKSFGARAYAKNFTEEELLCAVRLCHLHGVRLYVTLNVLINDKEIDCALDYAERLYTMGVDALIIADTGLVSLIKERIPDLELHASTHMGIHNRAGADLAYRLGLSRVVLARECSGKDISDITASCLPETEVFLHGALCVCHSGQCLFSSMVGGRSGNRGECAQPCRLPYNSGKYPLSLKDLSLADHITELIASGVSSLKIEGRMKSPSYVYEVTSIYRKLLDEGRNATEKEKNRLAEVFSRGGFTDGYFTNKLSGKMTGIRTEADKRASRELDEKDLILPKIRLTARCDMALGKPSRLTLFAKLSERGGRETEISASAEGAMPSEAISSPLEKDSVAARLSKMGSTPFSLSPLDTELTLGEGINLPPSAINELRRQTADMLLSKLEAPLSKLLGKKDHNPGGIDISDHYGSPRGKRTVSALFHKGDTLLSVNRHAPELISDIDIIFLPLSELLSGDCPEANGVYLPPIITESEWDGVKLKLASLSESVRYALVSNISHFELIESTPLIPVADARLNITNRHTRALYRSLGADTAILSAELTLAQIRDIGGGAITLGRIPLMLTERCFIKENFGCDKCGKASLRDRRGMEFPIMREAEHRNIIFNSAPTYMGDKRAELKEYRVFHEHFIFSCESASECEALLSAYKKGAPINGAPRRLGRR